MIVTGTILLVLTLLLVIGQAARLGMNASTRDGSSSTSSGPTPGGTAGSHALAVGDCITDAQYETRAMYPDPTPCSDPDAIFKLAYRTDSPRAAKCPDGALVGSKYVVLVSDSHLYCFALNATVGQCFAVDPVDGNFHSASCTDPRANAKVDQIIEGQTELSACPAGPSGSAVPEPPRVICTVKP